jgi:hypothetical protein
LRSFAFPSPYPGSRAGRDHNGRTVRRQGVSSPGGRQLNEKFRAALLIEPKEHQGM